MKNEHRRLSWSRAVLWAFALVIAVLACTGSVFAVLVSPAKLQESRALTERSERRPVIRTDKNVYLAGEIIWISGAGFSPFERMALRVAHTDGTLETGMGHEPWFINAGPDG